MGFQLIRTLRNNRPNGVSAKPVPNPNDAVGFISCQSAWSCSRTAPGLRDAYRIQDVFESSRFVALPRRDFDGEGNAVAVRNQVELA
jgi:hypothetical protein